MILRNILLCVLVLFAPYCWASLPNEFFVYTPHAGGKDAVCRVIFKLYAEKYLANPVFITKQGASGLIAMEEMLKDKKFSVLCSGNSESMFNNEQYPGHEESHKLLMLVSTTAQVTTGFYTGVNNPANDIRELLKTSKLIKVGYHTNGTKFIAQVAFKDYPIMWVPYKTPGDSLPSLIDGSLDLYTDGGSLDILVKGGKIKSIGHINGADSTSGPDVTKDFPDAAKIKSILAISTSLLNNMKDIEELNQRLKPLIYHPDVVKILSDYAGIPYWLSVKDSNDLIIYMRSKYKLLGNR
jgi:tripartite-type tricarboxylate transporter receptor subunit TctC